MSAPIKVLYVIDQYKNPYAGTEGQLHKLVDSVDRAEIEPHLLVFSSSSYIESKQFPCPVTVLGHNKLSSFATWRNMWRVARQFRRDGFKIVHVFFNDPSIIVPPIFSMLGFKVIISRRDMGYWYTPFYKRILRFNSRFVSAAIVNSAAVGKMTSETENIPASRVHVIYNGYGEAIGSTTRPDDIERLLTGSEFVVGIVANIRPIMRLEDAVRAISIVAKDRPEVKLIVVGDGDSSELKSLAANLGIANNVYFAGPSTRPHDYIRCFDVALLCSQSEGFSNSIIEYMQNGKPVVCSRVGGNPEIVVEGETGYLYETGDVEKLASLIRMLAADSDLRQRLGANSSKLVKEKFSMNTMVNAHIRLYKRLLGMSEKLDGQQVAIG